MESNIIRWLNNSNDSVLDSILLLSRNSFFISRPSLIEFANSKTYIFKKYRKGLSNEQFNLLSHQILNILPSYYLNSGENEIIFDYNIGKENNLKFESSIRQLIENNLILNSHNFIKINNNNNNTIQNNNDFINSVNNNNFKPNSNSVSIDLKKLQNIQNDCNDIGENQQQQHQQQHSKISMGKCIIKNNSPNETTVIELVPNSQKEYFNKNIPLEIIKLMDAKEYHSFMQSLNGIYSGNVFTTLYIFFYLISLVTIIMVGFYTYDDKGVIICSIVFSIITVFFVIFFIFYSYHIKYRILSNAIRKQNLKLIKNNSPLEFVLVYKQVKYPQTKDKITLQILIIKNDYEAYNNQSNINNSKEIENVDLREDIINETINNNLNKLNQIDN